MGAARVRNVLTRIVTAAACLAIVAFATAADARTPPITQTSIGGAKLGLSASAYKRLLGKPNFKLPLNDPAGKPTGWSRLVFLNVTATSRGRLAVRSSRPGRGVTRPLPVRVRAPRSRT